MDERIWAALEARKEEEEREHAPRNEPSSDDDYYSDDRTGSDDEGAGDSRREHDSWVCVECLFVNYSIVGLTVDQRYH